MTLLKTTAKPLAPNVRLTNNDGTPTKEFHEFLTRLDAWLGKIDIPVVPPLPPEPPADGGEYVRVNGVWRLSGQTFVMDGLAQKDVTVPVGARAVAIAAVSGSTISNWLALRISLDGTTFLAGATAATIPLSRRCRRPNSC
jgi:hypothetical protein